MRDEKAILVPNIYTEQETTKSSEKSLEEIWKEIRDEEDRLPKFSRFTPIEELLTEDDEAVEWIIDRFIRKNGFSILTAKPKVGKSTFARQLSLAVAQGVPFLGFETIKSPVFYISLEEIRDEVKRHFRQMGANGSERLDIFIDTLPENPIEWLREEIQNRKPALVVIDPLFKFVKATDVNDYAKIINALEPIIQLARNHNVHIMALHHARKGMGEGSDVTLGSTAIFGSVDMSILLKKEYKNSNIRIIETEPRYGETIEPTILNFDSEKKIMSIGITKNEDNLERMKTEILNLLKNSSDGVIEKEIDEQVEGRTTYKRNALRDLFEESKIGRNGTGRKGDPYIYYSKTFLTITTENDKVIA